MSIIKILVSVNYYFSCKCNYKCGFYFYIEKTFIIFSLNEAKREMKLLKESGIKKLKFTSDKPFLYPIFIRELFRYKKEELRIKSINIVLNGLKIIKKFLYENAAFINILVISCNLFDLKTNIKIERGTSKKNVK
jgi:radical S-adenosyl methionine domain-containing protein 2